MINHSARASPQNRAANQKAHSRVLVVQERLGTNSLRVAERICMERNHQLDWGTTSSKLGLRGLLDACGLEEF